MSRVDEKQTRWSGRASLLFYWKRTLVAGVLLVLGLALPEGHALASAAGWLTALGGLLLGWTLALVFFGGRHWVTSDQVVQSLGVVSRHTEELEISASRNVSVHQGWIERLLGVGSVRLRSEGRDMVLAGVKQPEAVADLIRRGDPGSSSDPGER